MPYEGIDYDLQLMVEAMRHGTHYTGGSMSTPSWAYMWDG